MRKENELEYTLANGQGVTIHYEATYEVVDNGIGAYEYWGSKEVDIQLDTECSDCSLISVDDENDEDIYDTLSPEEKKAVEQAASEHAEENRPELEQFCDERDPDEKRDYERDRDYYES